jgi:hypothetical protein
MAAQKDRRKKRAASAGQEPARLNVADSGEPANTIMLGASPTDFKPLLNNFFAALRDRRMVRGNGIIIGSITAKLQVAPQ